MTIYLITSNISKYQEIKKVLANFSIKLKRIDIDLPEIKSLAPRQVVIDKVNKAYKIVKKPVIVDDTSLFFSGYNQFPGTISRFIFMTLGFSGIFKLIKNNHSAYFESYIAYLDKKSAVPHIFTGKCQGKLIKKILGKKRTKMPYDNIFIPLGETKTFAQLGVAMKQKYDHRTKAVIKLAKYLTKIK